MESALRHVVGSSTMDNVITEGRAALGSEVQERLQSYLNLYQTGILVQTVNIDESGPPDQVQEAFDDVQKAKEDEQRFVNLANAYLEKVGSGSARSGATATRGGECLPRPGAGKGTGRS